MSETQVLLAGVLSGRCVLQEQLNRASAPTIGTQRENELVSLIRFSSFNSTNKILQPIYLCTLGQRCQVKMIKIPSSSASRMQAA